MKGVGGGLRRSVENLALDGYELMATRPSVDVMRPKRASRAGGNGAGRMKKLVGVRRTNTD